MPSVTARNGQSSSSLNVRRPAWSLVYDGYPKVNGGTAYEDDLSAVDVFTGIFGTGYNTVKYGNACATRVSLGLLSGGMRKIGDTKITEKSHVHYGKYIEPGAEDIKNFLVKKWGKADHVIRFPSGLQEVSVVLNNKKGIYIMIPKVPRDFGATGHATLWTGGRVIGDHHYISNNTHAVYFWELK